MIKWLKEYSDSTAQTKSFVLNGLVYGLAMVITTVYCYARLDFVRSYPTPAMHEAKQKEMLNESKTTPQSQAIK
jgi:hypothetical protein